MDRLISAGGILYSFLLVYVLIFILAFSFSWLTWLVLFPLCMKAWRSQHMWVALGQV